jgi:diguanylate cyclase (GGDEF)-like protein
MAEAFQSQDLRFAPDVEREGVRQSVIAVPMVVKAAVLGVIHIQLKKIRRSLSDVDTRFYRIVAGTAANALNNAQMFEEMERRASTDFLTGLPNHRFFDTTLNTELSRAQRYSRPLSLLMIDLDYLKEVNDRYGHQNGDHVIRVVGETIRRTCREVDFAARYGGEEYMVILPDTSLAGAVQVAERMREKIAEVDFPGMGNITASIGVSNFPLNAIGRDDLIQLADQALYVAKSNGRNRVSSFNYQLITRRT